MERGRMLRVRQVRLQQQAPVRMQPPVPVTRQQAAQTAAPAVMPQTQLLLPPSALP